MKRNTPCCRIGNTTGGVAMSRQYTKVEAVVEEVFRLKAEGKTHREIGEMYGLSKIQIKELVSRQNRKRRLIANGYLPRPKGRPRKDQADESIRKDNELAELRMQVKLLQNFLYEAGRR